MRAGKGEGGRGREIGEGVDEVVCERADAIAHTFPLKPSRMAEDDVEHWKGLAEERLKT